MSTPTPPPAPVVPNVIIRDAKTRERIYDIFGCVGLILFAVVAGDAIAPQVDLTPYTAPALAVYSVLGAGIGYTARQNTPVT